jgi:hypothetical protein
MNVTNSEPAIEKVALNAGVIWITIGVTEKSD